MHVSIEEACSKLAELIEGMVPGEEIVITKDDRPIARLERLPVRPNKPRQPGTMKGTVTYMAPDFDAPLDDFEDYMP